LHFLEMELGTNRTTAVREKLISYDRWAKAESGEYLKTNFDRQCEQRPQHANFRLLLVACLSIMAVSDVFGSGEETFGNKPFPESNFGDWPNVMPVVNDTHRVYHSWVNGNENFYFRGDTDALNIALKSFAQVKAEKLTVILRPAPGRVSSFNEEQKFVFNWQLHLLGGIAKHMSTRDQGSNVWDPNPEFIIYVGGDIVLDRIEIPENVDVLQLADLKARYEKSLKSTHTDVRGWTCGQIAALDQYDAASMQKIAAMLDDDDDWVKLNAAGSLSVFSAHASEVEKALRNVETDDVQLKARIESTLNALQESVASKEEHDSHDAMLSDIAKFISAHRNGK